MSDAEVKVEDHSERVSETSSQPTLKDESAFEKLIGNIYKVERQIEDDLERIRSVIKSINDFQTEDVPEYINMNINMNNVSQFPNLNGENKKPFIVEYKGECGCKTKDDQQNRTATDNDPKKQQKGLPQIKIIFTIKSCNKNANSKKKKKGPGQAGTRKKTEQSKIEQNLTGNFKTDVKLLKAVFNYLQPLIMWDESIKETKNENKIIEQLYFIVRTTRNVLCHWRCFFDETLFLQMRSNIKNLYDILGVDLNEKKRQENLETDYNKINANLYYYAPGGVKYPNDSKQIIEVSRDIINREIKSLIMRGHSEGEVINSNSQSIILFGSLLHYLVGTRDTNNWSNITGYFDGYEIEPLKDGVNGASTADPNNFNIKSKHQEDFFFEAIKLKIHWAQMLLRYKDEDGADGSNIREISSALRPESTAQLGDLLREIISEKKEKLNYIINSIESTGQSGSAHKIGSAAIDVFFKQLIDCKQIAYISSADATTLSNNSPLTQAELKQRNKRLTADFTANSNRLILCPLEVQNQWFLFVADLANNQCSLHGCLGNDSVSAPHVQKLCNTFLNNLRNLPNLEDLKDIPKGKEKKQPQNIDKDCGSFICSLAFNLVYCPLHLYPKDVRRIYNGKNMKND